MVRTESAEGAIQAIDAIYRGGIRVAEITMTVPGALRALEKVADKFGDQIVLGAGTVLDPETARACMLAGAEFIVTPSLNLATIEMAKRYSKVITPGALTPTEVVDGVAGRRRRDQSFSVQRGGRREIHQSAARAVSANRDDSDRWSESGNCRGFSAGRRLRGGGGRGVD